MSFKNLPEFSFPSWYSVTERSPACVHATKDECPEDFTGFIYIKNMHV